MTTAKPQYAVLDLNLEPNRAIPRWSETRWNGCWCPEDGVGLYLHMGRFRHDLDIWWAQTVAYLPDGQLAVDRSWCRGSEDRTQLSSTAYTLENTDGGWSSSYRGALQLTTVAACEFATQGAGAPAVPVRWEVSAEPISPLWDLYAAVATDRDATVGDTHIQQGFVTRGELTVGDRSYRLDGFGFKDHSSGTREWDGYGAHNFLLTVTPEWTLHAIMLYGPAGEPRGPMATLFRDGEPIRVTKFELEKLSSLAQPARDYPVTVELETGEVMELTASLLHEVPITITDNGDNVNGIDWDAELPSVVLQEGIARVTAADGVTGYSMFERGRGRQDLVRPPIS